jgi:hypothetical protein
MVLSRTVHAPSIPVILEKSLVILIPFLLLLGTGAHIQNLTRYWVITKLVRKY